MAAYVKLVWHALVFCLWTAGILLVALLHGENAPVSVHNCSVHDAGAGHVAFEAAVRNHTTKPVRLVRFITTTTGGAFVEYTLDGHISPHYWTYEGSRKNVEDDAGNLQQHLGWVWDCEVHAVAYQDGTNWLGPSPL